MTANDRPRPQFAAANNAVLQAVVKIERAVVDLLEQTADLDGVAHDYVIETLIARLVVPNPQVLDWLNKQRGEASIRLANAVADWRDDWVGR
jgi:hypothetical protein